MTKASKTGDKRKCPECKKFYKAKRKGQIFCSQACVRTHFVEGGRKTKMNEEVMQKLDEAFMHGFTDEEACLHAGIATTTLYNFIIKNSKYGERKELLKKKPSLKAKLNIIGSMQGTVKEVKTADGSKIFVPAITTRQQKASERWLERKSKAEFSLRIENEISEKGNPLEDLKTKTKTNAGSDQGVGKGGKSNGKGKV